MALDRMDGIDRRRVLGLLAALGGAGLSGGLAGCATLPGNQVKDPVRLGLLVPATGSRKVVGADLEKGFRLYLDMNGGSLAGHPVELVVEDEGDSIASGTSALEALYSQNVIAVTGVANSDLLPSILDTVEKTKIPLLAAHGAAADLSSSFYIWHTAFMNSDPGTAVGLYLKTKGVAKVGLIGLKDTFTEDAMNGLSNEHGNVTDRVWIEPTSKPQPSDFNSEINALLNQQPDAVFCSLPTAYLVPFLQALRSTSSGSALEVYAPGLVSETLTADQLKDARDLFTATQYSSDLNNPSNRAFSAQFQARHGGSPTSFAVAAYDAAAVLDSAIALCGDDEVTPFRLTREIPNVGQVTSPRGNWQFNQSRSPQQKWYLRQVRLDGPIWSNVLIGDLATLGTG